MEEFLVGLPGGRLYSSQFTIELSALFQSCKIRIATHAAPIDKNLGNCFHATPFLGFLPGGLILPGQQNLLKGNAAPFQ